MSPEAVEIFQKPNMGFYFFKKLVKEYGSLKEFAEEKGVNLEVLNERFIIVIFIFIFIFIFGNLFIIKSNSIALYNKNKEEGTDEFGKKTFPASFSTEGPVYGMMITPGIHYTMGGNNNNISDKNKQKNHQFSIPSPL